MRTAPFHDLQADTIGGVIDSLDVVVDWARENGHRLGYFAALYRKVTVCVEAAIAAGEFADGDRMERLDVVFANRYLAALEQACRGETCTTSWQLALDACSRWRPIALQHLLLGMNAHIALDLAIAAVETAPAGELDALRGDFDLINDILASLTDGVQDELARVWPALRLLDRLGGRIDEALAGFGLVVARSRAWEVAGRLAAVSGPERSARISVLDRQVATFGERILAPGLVAAVVLLAIRLTEMRSVRRIIEILE